MTWMRQPDRFLLLSQMIVTLYEIKSPGRPCRGTCYLEDMLGPPKFMLVWYIFSGMLFLFILGKRHMEATVVKMCKRYENCEMARTNGTFKTRQHKQNKFTY